MTSGFFCSVLLHVECGFFFVIFATHLATVRNTGWEFIVRSRVVFVRVCVCVNIRCAGRWGPGVTRRWPTDHSSRLDTCHFTCDCRQVSSLASCLCFVFQFNTSSGKPTPRLLEKRELSTFSLETNRLAVFSFRFDMCSVRFGGRLGL